MKASLRFSTNINPLSNYVLHDDVKIHCIYELHNTLQQHFIQCNPIILIYYVDTVFTLHYHTTHCGVWSLLTNF